MTHPVKKLFYNTVMSFVLNFGFYSAPIMAAEMPETDGTFFAISVRNIDESAAWYTNHLGFKIVSKGGNDDRTGALLTRPGTVLELAQFAGAVERNAVAPGLESHEIHGLFKIGFVTANLDESFKFFESDGVEILFPIVTASDGNRTFGITDLDGNIIQFFGK